jgi:putative ABC transport system ATP-binding protein
MLELDQVCKLYASPGAAVHAIDGVSMSVSAGELVALFGPSGSGKTTLLMLAGGLLRPDSGSVRFQGSDLAALSRRELLDYRRTKLGFVFQNYHLVQGLTAEENVAMTLLMRGATHRDAHRRARAALDDVGLLARTRHTPEELSGGEQQRVAIARALVGEPTLVLADEPTGNLDTDTGDHVLDLLNRLPREHGAATVLVTHDQRVARYADRKLTLRDGRLAAEEPDAEPEAALDA